MQSHQQSKSQGRSGQLCGTHRSLSVAPPARRGGLRQHPRSYGITGRPCQELTDDQADYLDVLADIIQKYEARHHPVNDRATPLSSLKNMLEERDMSASDLGRLLGNRALGSAILRGDRELSKSHIRILADYFKVSTDLFIA